MALKTVLTVAVLSLGLVAGQAYAGEGAGNPFPNQGAAHISGQAFLSDTGSAAYPVLTGLASQAPAATLMAASAGSEMPIESLNSRPAGFELGTAIWAQSHLKHRVAELVTARAYAAN